MGASNLCYKRKGLQDPNDPTKCLDVDQPAKVLAQDEFGNTWYDFNVDYEKKGVVCTETECEDLPTADYIKNGAICDLTADPPTCEVLPVGVYKRKGLQDPNDPTKCLAPYKGIRDFQRRDTDNVIVDTDKCPPDRRTVESGFISLSDFELGTESEILIISEHNNQLNFELEVNTSAPAGSFNL